MWRKTEWPASEGRHELPRSKEHELADRKLRPAGATPSSNCMIIFLVVLFMENREQRMENRESYRESASYL